MLPCRGLRWSSHALNNGNRRIGQPSVRTLSYTSSNRTSTSTSSRTAQLLTSHGASPMRLSSRSQFLRSSSITPLALGVRHNSTIPSSNPGPTTLPTSSTTTSLPETIDPGLFEKGSLLDIPEHIGYLKSLGLDFGWGPTSMVEWFLEHIHVLTGAPWWASIAMTAIAFRLLMLKPYINAADNAAKMATVAPITKPLTAKMMALQSAGADTTQIMAVRREMQIIHKRAGISIMKGFIPLAQVPLGYGSFVLLRAMADLPVPGMETGGILWFQNLAVSDPIFLLPAITAGVMHLVLRKGGETGVNTMNPGLLKAMSYGFPAVTFLITSWMPAGLQFSFFVSGLMSAGQATAFRSKSIRSFLRITPMPAKTTNPFDAKPEDAPSDYQPRVVVAKKDSYRPTYEAPRSTSSKPDIYGTGLSSEAENKGLLSGLKKKVGGSIESTRKSMVNNIQEASKQLPGYTAPGTKSKQELKKLAAYEKKRREEEQQALLERDQIRRQERLMKQQARQKN